MRGSIFHSLKVEWVHGEHFACREIILPTVVNYVVYQRLSSVCWVSRPLKWTNTLYGPLRIRLPAEQIRAIVLSCG
ncbi:IS3 family transposase [Salmonella enterica]|nr:IS3 family transposase [Salmonella enterica]